jgi:hypothetical protein
MKLAGTYTDVQQQRLVIMEKSNMYFFISRFITLYEKPCADITARPVENIVGQVIRTRPMDSRMDILKQYLEFPTQWRISVTANTESAIRHLGRDRP